MIHLHISFQPSLSQHALVILWAPYFTTRLTARCAIPPTETASASLESGGSSATGAWWDIGAFMSTAAARATVQETATRLQETACSGKSKDSCVDFKFRVTLEQEYPVKYVNCNLIFKHLIQKMLKSWFYQKITSQTPHSFMYKRHIFD